MCIGTKMKTSCSRYTKWDCLLQKGSVGLHISHGPFIYPTFSLRNPSAKADHWVRVDRSVRTCTGSPPLGSSHLSGTVAVNHIRHPFVWWRPPKRRLWARGESFSMKGGGCLQPSTVITASCQTIWGCHEALVLSYAICPFQFQLAVLLLIKHYQVPCGCMWISGGFIPLGKRLIPTFW